MNGTHGFNLADSIPHSTAGLSQVWLVRPALETWRGLALEVEEYQNDWD
jgi:hypothetical protein